jgi:parallel beta-helix repeat protein
MAGNTVTGAAGTRDGIIVSRGAEATIDGNTVQSWGRLGINLDLNGTARIINNTIQNNLSSGVSVGGSSSGRIGFLTFGDTSAGPNTIQNNGRDGVNVNRSSTAIILSNTIRNNTRHGVGIFRASHADVGGNTIESNGFPPPSPPATNDGIRVEENSGVNLGQPGVAFAVGGNTTTVPAGNNAGFGLRCAINSYARGSRGTLNGTLVGNSDGGQTEFSVSCVNATSP